MAVRQLLKYKFHTIVSMLCMGIGLTFNAYLSCFLDIQFSGPSNEVNIFINDAHLTANDYKQIVDKKIEGIENLRAIMVRSHTTNAFIEDNMEEPYQVFIKSITPLFMRQKNSTDNYRFYPISEGRDSIGNNEVIVSNGFAQRVFGETSAIGKSITLVSDSIIPSCDYNGHSYRIAGVLDMGKDNTSWIYVPMFYNNDNVYISADITDGYTKKNIQEKFNNIEWKSAKDGAPLNMLVRLPNYITWEERIAYIIISIFSWLIFIIGFVNFMKFIIQMFYARQRELVLRKCMGSDNRGLYMLLASEVACMLLLSFIVSCITSELSLNYLNYMNISTNNIITLPLLILTQAKSALIALVIGLVVILIPIIKLRKMELQKAMLRHRQGGKMQKTMLALQFAISIIFFIVLGWAILIKGFDEGWRPDKLSKEEQQRIIWVPKYERHWDEIRPQIEKLPIIEDHVYCNSEGLSSNTFNYYECIIGSDTLYTTILANGDPRYFKFFNIEISGQIVSPEEGNYIYIDRSMLDKLQQRDTFDGNVIINSKSYQIAGVIEDNLFPEMKVAYVDNKGEFPICGFLFLVDDTFNTFYYRIKEGVSSKEAKKAIANVIHRYVPQSFDVEENIKSLYEWSKERYKQTNAMIHIFYLIVFICLLVVILSVYSSISLDAATRQKEIAIRKINGAHSTDILKHFIAPYAIIYTITFLIVYPPMINFFLLQLNNGHRFEIITIEHIIIYGLTVYFITTGLLLLTTWKKIRMIMRLNPADVIRRE